MNIKSNDAVIFSYARTALGKAFRGGFNATHGVQPGKASVVEALGRAGIDPGEISDVLTGCGFPDGPTGFNSAWQILIAAGLGNEVPGMTINRFCASSLQAIATALQAVPCGVSGARIFGSGLLETRRRSVKHFLHQCVLAAVWARLHCSKLNRSLI